VLNRRQPSATIPVCARLKKQGRFASTALAGDVNVVPRLGAGKQHRRAVLLQSQTVMLAVDHDQSRVPCFVGWPPRRAVNRLGMSGSRWGWPADERASSSILHDCETVWL
jgi:hypothetical protein